MRTPACILARRSRRAVLTGLAGALLCAAGASASDRPQNAGREVVGQSYDQIMERGWILIGVYEDLPPWSWEEDGKLVGVDVEIGRLIAEDLGVEARFRSYAADETMDDDLRNNVWKGHYIGGAVVNVMMRVPYNREFALRNDLVVITGLYMTERVAIAYREDAYPDGDAPTPAYFRFDKVGVETDSVADFYLSGLANGQAIPNIRHYRSVAEAMAGLAEGETAAVMGPRGQLEAGAVPGVKVHAPSLPGLSIGEWPLGVAVRHTYRQLGYAVDDAIAAAVQDGRIAAIFARHGLTYAPPAW